MRYTVVLNWNEQLGYLVAGEVATRQRTTTLRGVSPARLRAIRAQLYTAGCEFWGLDVQPE